MDLNNVLEGARQYFMGLPKQVQAESSGQPAWPAAEEGAPAQSGAPAPSSRPPSAAAAPPPRPPSEPLEPEPHIIHKATVMREAAEKRRELPDDDEDDDPAVPEPPPHVIRKPLPSPSPAPAAPCPSPARPPSTAAPPQSALAEQHPPEPALQYRPPPPSVPRGPQPMARPLDPYPSSRPSELSYSRYSYEAVLSDPSRSPHGQAVASPQPSARRPSPLTYSRMSTMPPHAPSRGREPSQMAPIATSSQRYVPPPNDRVPPVPSHHPQAVPASRSAPLYPAAALHREPSPYSRITSPYDRHPSIPQRKYDPQQTFPGYRQQPAPQPPSQHRIESHHQQYKLSQAESTAYAAGRTVERVTQQPHTGVAPPPEPSRLPPRPEYLNSSTRSMPSGYHYHSQVQASSSATRYASVQQAPVVPTASGHTHLSHRPVVTPKNNIPPSLNMPSRSASKPCPPSQVARQTVSVTSLVEQINQTKQKRESPLDLSVKTVKNSADSTAQDDLIDSASTDIKTCPVQPRVASSSWLVPPSSSGFEAAHKVDFSPNFSQYRERSSHQPATASYSASSQHNHTPLRHNGAYEVARPPEVYPNESRVSTYHDRNKYNAPVARSDYIHKIDLTRPVEDRRRETRIRDDRYFIIEDRKRAAAPITSSHIPEKIMRHETYDSRIERINRSAREQRELMSQPVYSYTSHKRLESYHSEQKRLEPQTNYRDHYLSGQSRYSNPSDSTHTEQSNYSSHYHDRGSTSNNRHVIQKVSSHRDLPPHYLDPHSGIPADKRVISLLRNSLESKQPGFVDPAKPARNIPDLIVIDDVEDSVIEITDENDSHSMSQTVPKVLDADRHIHMPKAVGSISRDHEHPRLESDSRTSLPENDFSSRIRTKAELKGLPPSQDVLVRTEISSDKVLEPEKTKLLPKSQKQHLFNQIREDLRLESVIKSEKRVESATVEVKSEPMNVDEIEKDAVIPIKCEVLENGPINTEETFPAEEDLDWATACDSFMEQLKTGCHKKKMRQKRLDTSEPVAEIKKEKQDTSEVCPESTRCESPSLISGMFGQVPQEIRPEHNVVIKQEPIDEEEFAKEVKLITDLSEEPKSKETAKELSSSETIEAQLNIDTEEKTELKRKSDSKETTDSTAKSDTKHEIDKKKKTDKAKIGKGDKTKSPSKDKIKSEKKLDKKQSELTKLIKQEPKEKDSKVVVKEESESTDDDEPLINSKIMKEKEKSDFLKHQLLKDLSEKSAYVKLECFNVDMNKNNRRSFDLTKVKEEKPSKAKVTRQTSKSKLKSLSNDFIKNEDAKPKDSGSDSDEDEISVASRLRNRKPVKPEDSKNTSTNKISKSSPSKKLESTSSASSVTGKKPGFGDGSDFHPGWEEELYKYKRSLRMPSRLIAIPLGRSGGHFGKGSGNLFSRGSTSLPDLDPAPLSPAPSSAPSAATDDLYTRRQDKLTLDSDVESNSSSSIINKLQYDSEASTSTVFSSSVKKKGSSIVDVLIQKCGKRDESKKKQKDSKEDTPKIIPKSVNQNELLPTPSLGLEKDSNKGSLSVKKEKLRDQVYYLGNFRKETVAAFRDAFLENTDGVMGAMEEFAPIVLKSRTRTESKVLKQRATIKEVFGDDRPASAPPSCAEEDVVIKEEVKKEPESKPKSNVKKILKQKLKLRSTSIRDGLRSTKSLKRNDAKGRLMRLKNRNNIQSLTNKRVKESSMKLKKDSSKSPSPDAKDVPKVDISPEDTEIPAKRRFKRLFARKKFSSGFDYIRKKKKTVLRKDETNNKIRRTVPKASPESESDLHKEIKGWMINKSIGETHLHRAARLGYTDCVAYCLEKMESDPSAKDNAGYTPLHVAAANGHVRIARLLLQYGANISAAAQGGIRPLHEACENSHVEVIRLLLSYGADPVLGTYGGQRPEELAEGAAAMLLQQHIAEVQGSASEPWRFPPPACIQDKEELGCDPLSSPPPSSPPPPDSTIEIQCTEAPLPPFYSLRGSVPNQPVEGLWCLLQDVTNVLQIKSKESLLKQIHCGSGSPKELFREIRTQEFLERAQCHQLMCAGEKVNVRASKVALVRVTDKLRQLLKIETVLIS